MAETGTMTRKQTTEEADREKLLQNFHYAKSEYDDACRSFVSADITLAEKKKILSDATQRVGKLLERALDNPTVPDKELEQYVPFDQRRT